jgi:tetratricopeptide (TPR) repeat protein
MDYTAIGDPVNLASRMEGLAEPGTVYVTNDTFKLTEGFFQFKSLGKVSVKGKEQKVEAYQLIEAGDVETRIESSVRKGLNKFVGRKKEIEALKEDFEKAHFGSGQVVGIVGEAGVGKSRVLLEFRGSLPQEECIYLEGHCLHYGESMPYLPLMDILRSYFDIKELEPELLIKKKLQDKITELDENLSIILSPLFDLLSLKVEDEEYIKLKPPQKREKIFEALKDLLIQESQNRTLIIAIEDLHWIDKTTEEFLTYFIGFLANTRILLIVLYRPEHTHQWASKSYYSHISIDQLSTMSSAELVQSILEDGEILPELSELIITRAGGNPLYVEELTYTLLENGSIQKNDHQYVLTMKAFNIEVPDTIQGIIAARMDRLQDELKRTIQVASVIGRDFAYRILYAITGMKEELKSYLVELQGLEFVYEKNLFPELEYIFKHALTQEVAYSSLLFRKRKKLHEQIADAIELLYQDRLEEFYEMLAYHYSKSEESDKALHYLKLSGEKAALRYSNWEAFHFYKEAINVLDKQPHCNERNKKAVELRLLMDHPTRCLGYPGDSLYILEDGERLSKEIGDFESLAKFYSSIGFYHLIRGNPHQGIVYAEKCFREAAKVQDIDLVTQTGFDLCASYTAIGDYIKIAEVAKQATDLLEKTKRESEFFGGPYNLNLYSAFLMYSGLAMTAIGNTAQGDQLCKQGLGFALEINNRRSIGWAELIYCTVLNLKGDGGSAMEHSQNAIRYIEETQTVFLLGIAWVFLGWSYYFLGDLDTARKYVEKGIRIQQESGLSIMMSQHFYFLGTIALDSGDIDSARSCAEEAINIAQNDNEKLREGDSRILWGRVVGKTERSDWAKAEESILQGIQIIEELNLILLRSRGYFFLGELYADAGQDKKAIKTLKEAEAAFQEMGMDYWLHRTQEVLVRVEG